MIKHLLGSTSELIELSTDKEICDAVKTILLAKDARAKALDALICLFEHGPVYDGDVPSKNERDWLVSNGLAAKVVFKGEDSYQALTYKGVKCYRLILAQKLFESSKVKRSSEK